MAAEKARRPQRKGRVLARRDMPTWRRWRERGGTKGTRSRRGAKSGPSVRSAGAHSGMTEEKQTDGVFQECLRKKTELFFKYIYRFY